MQQALVVTDEMLPIPENIEVLVNWGYVGVISNGTTAACGDHMLLKGSQKDFIDWLKPFNGIWRTKPGTSVMMQEFEVVHVPLERGNEPEEKTKKGEG